MTKKDERMKQENLAFRVCNAERWERMVSIRLQNGFQFLSSVNVKCPRRFVGNVRSMSMEDSGSRHSGDPGLVLNWTR
jgi:hypothetical protein